MKGEKLALPVNECLLPLRLALLVVLVVAEVEEVSVAWAVCELLVSVKCPLAELKVAKPLAYSEILVWAEVDKVLIDARLPYLIPLCDRSELLALASVSGWLASPLVSVTSSSPGRTAPHSVEFHLSMVGLVVEVLEEQASFSQDLQEVRQRFLHVLWQAKV